MRKGFTLLELLVVIAILGVMATFIIVRFTGGQAAARDARRQSDVRQFQSAVEIYANANNGLYPSTSPGSNVTVNAINLCGSGPLGSIPCVDDPTGGSAHYQYSVNSGRTQYVIWATLEKVTPATRFYVCSSGKTGTQLASVNPPSGGACP
jgi:prepilin-type N-terminal cleavage/methylation domain-containing protein